MNGDIIDKRSEIFPPPAEEPCAKLEGFAPNKFSHSSEDRYLDEVLLLVNVMAMLCTYLTRMIPE